MNVTFVFLSNPPIALLVVQGELDLGNRDQLVARLAELRELEVDVLYLDVGHVTFVDCSCMSELELARRRLLRAGRRLELVAASPIFLKVARRAHYPELSATGQATRLPTPAAARWWSLVVETSHRARATAAGWLSGLAPKL